MQVTDEMRMDDAVLDRLAMAAWRSDVDYSRGYNMSDAEALSLWSSQNVSGKKHWRTVAQAVLREMEKRMREVTDQIVEAMWRADHPEAPRAPCRAGPGGDAVSRRAALENSDAVWPKTTPAERADLRRACVRSVMRGEEFRPENCDRAIRLTEDVAAAEARIAELEAVLLEARRARVAAELEATCIVVPNGATATALEGLHAAGRREGIEAAIDWIEEWTAALAEAGDPFQPPDDGFRATMTSALLEKES